MASLKDSDVSVTHAIAIPKPRRWFVYSTVGLFLFLSIALILAALVLMRKGAQPRTASILGCSMEPTLRGRRLVWTCPECGAAHAFGADSIVEGVPLRCPRCNAVDTEFDRQSAENIEKLWVPGEKVEYLPWRVMQSKRMAIPGSVWDYRGLRRGDLVVLQEDEASLREVKRVVGFPGETIEIRSGDLFVGGKRWERTTNQILQQSVLIHYGVRQPSGGEDASASGVRQEEKSQTTVYAGKGVWSFQGEAWEYPLCFMSSPGLEQVDEVSQSEERSPSDDETSNKSFEFAASSAQPADGDGASPDRPCVDRIEFEPMHPLGICNDYVHNAHDSHQLVRVRDIGVAFQMGRSSESWELSVSLNTHGIPWQSVLEFDNGTLTVVSEDVTAVLEEFRGNSSRWLILMCVDGMGVVATSEKDLLRVPLPSESAAGLEPSEMDTSSYPIALECKHGRIECEQWMVFRDIHYRGVDDNSRQRLDAQDGIVVLGDNVSLSADSRQRWVDGLGIETLRGVVLPRTEGIEALLKQRP